MRIMVCYDDSEEAKDCLREAEKHARAFNGEVLVVTSVISDHKYNPKMMEPFEKGLDEAQAFFDGKGIPCRTHLSLRAVDVEAGEDLEGVAAREKVDEIIVGIKNRSKVGKLLLGSAAQFLMLRASCPVVGIKRKR